MFTKNRRQHSSLKHNTTTSSSTTLTKDRSPVITTGASSSSHSNSLLTPANGTSTQSSIQSKFLPLLRVFWLSIDLFQGSASNATSTSGNGSVRRRLVDLIRFTTSRPPSSVRFSRQRESTSCSSSKQVPNLSNASIHDNVSSPNMIKDEVIESMVASANDHMVNIISSTSPTTTNDTLETCVLCCHEYPLEQFERLSFCAHSYCRTCLRSYLKLEITEGRVTLNCPQSDCPERIHPCDISRILQKQPELIAKYEQFMVRRVLQSITDTRWCPAPDCGFAVIASGHASCPEIQCLRPGCNTSFCYHCKATWHPNKTCEDAAREKITRKIRSGSFISLASAQQSKCSTGERISDGHRCISGDEIKECPRCQASILKMDDGSCVSRHRWIELTDSIVFWLESHDVSDLWSGVLLAVWPRDLWFTLSKVSALVSRWFVVRRRFFQSIGLYILGQETVESKESHSLASRHVNWCTRDYCIDCRRGRAGCRNRRSDLGGPKDLQEIQ